MDEALFFTILFVSFFISGTIFGVILSIHLPHVELPLFGMSPNNFILVFQFVFTLFLLFSLESLIRNTRKIGMSAFFHKMGAFHFVAKE